MCLVIPYWSAHANGIALQVVRELVVRDGRELMGGWIAHAKQDGERVPATNVLRPHGPNEVMR